jgi:hypothetical protein
MFLLLMVRHEPDSTFGQSPLFVSRPLIWNLNQVESGDYLFLINTKLVLRKLQQVHTCLQFDHNFPLVSARKRDRLNTK